RHRTRVVDLEQLTGGVRDQCEHQAAVVPQVRTIRPSIAADRTIQCVDRISEMRFWIAAAERDKLITQRREQVLRQSHGESFAIHRAWRCDTQQLQDCWRDIDRLDLAQRAAANVRTSGEKDRAHIRNVRVETVRSVKVRDRQNWTWDYRIIFA